MNIITLAEFAKKHKKTYQAAYNRRFELGFKFLSGVWVAPKRTKWPKPKKVGRKKGDKK